MEWKHFSHQHPLLPHQLQQPSPIHCSGCKSPASGNLYACWQCSYFLHNQCVRAARSLNHPSHPLHPLTLVPYPTHPSSSFLCNSCNLVGHGFSYTCSHCDFDIHLHCALTPNPNPNPNPPQNVTNPNHTQINYPQSQPWTNPPNFHHNPSPPLIPPTTDPPPQLKHFSHPHLLKQTELDDGTTNPCSACELKLSGTTYCCTEPYCSFSLHKVCFDAPSEVRHKSHRHHPLTLLPAAPYTSGSFTCDACQKDGKGFAYCRECDFGTHLECGKSEMKPQVLYLRLQQLKIQARMDAEVQESALDLWDDRKKKYRYTFT